VAPPEPLVEIAPAKVNLTLRVLGRRPDGYHEIESLVVFAKVGDRLSFSPGGELALTVSGPNAAHAGAGADNLVLKAARALSSRVPGIGLGAFHLEKFLPVAAGIGGGSTDAAAALRLLARANQLSRDDPRLHEAARASGADVPVCLEPRPRLMCGIGERLSAPLALLPLPAVLVNPGAALATKDVFAQWRPAVVPSVAFDPGVVAKATSREKVLQFLAMQSNDLEAAAHALAPVIGTVLAALRPLPGCKLARMSGSGSTCFALFASAASAVTAAETLRDAYPQWWVRASAFAGADIA
jgi:4-diphosphocytidyl-2-C-methyl-D-erythritol kinase